jgi:hypothetical protein
MMKKGFSYMQMSYTLIGNAHDENHVVIEPNNLTYVKANMGEP